MRHDLLTQLQQALRAAGDSERAVQEKRYLKSTDVFLGVSVPAGQRIAKGFRREHPEMGFPEVQALAVALWQGETHEEERLAVQLLDLYAAHLTSDDWPLLERWVRESGSWDLVDEIAAHLLGVLCERCPSLDAELDRWVRDGDLWVRRAALVSHVLRIRRGTVATETVRRRCDSLMADGEYFVRKAVGWVLRECAVRDPEGTVPFLLRWAGQMPRPVLREAVRKLEPGTQARVLGMR